MSSWEFPSLSTLANVAGTKTDGNSELPVYSVTKHRGFVPSLEYFNKQVFSRDLKGYKIVEQGEFAYATIHLDEGSIGISPERCLVSPMYTVFSIDERQVDRGYLIRYLKSPSTLLEYSSMGKGAVVRRKSISFDALSQLKIPLPPVSEQLRITAILDTVDALRAKRRDATSQLDCLEQSIFLEMFGDPVSDPKGVAKTTLGDCIDDMQYGPRFHNEAYSENGIRILRITDLDRDGELNFDAMPKMAVDEDTQAQYSLRAGDVVFARTGATVGKVALIRKDDPPCIAGAYFIRLRFKKDIVPEFAYSVLRTKSVQALIAAQSRQAAQQNFSGPGLRRLPMPTPPLKRQEDFAIRLANVREMRKRYLKHLRTLDELLFSLQQRAFKGKI